MVRQKFQLMEHALNFPQKLANHLCSRNRDGDNESGGSRGGRYSSPTAAAPAATAVRRLPPPDASPRIDRKSLQAAAAKGRSKVSAGTSNLFSSQALYRDFERNKD